MTQTEAELTIGAITFFITSMVNAAMLGFFLGGIRAEVTALRTQVAELKGAFTLVPTSATKEGHL